MVDDLYNMINRIRVQAGVNDSWKWTRGSSGTYTTKKANDTIAEISSEKAIAQDKRMEFKIIWKNHALVKVSTTTWRLLGNRLPTKDNLLRRNIIPSREEAKCIFCNSTTESAAHLFLECDPSYLVRKDM